MKKPPAFAHWFKKTQKKLQEPGLTILLAFQVFALFLVAPLTDTPMLKLHWAIDVCISIMAFISVFIVAAGTTTAVSVCSLVLGIAGIIAGPHFTEQLGAQVITTISLVLFSGAVSWIVGSKIFNNEPVTIHKIRGAIIIYLNIALIFGYLDNLLSMILPGSFTNLAHDDENSIGRMIYFSLTTLTTTGYGDIVPLHPIARSLSNLEAVIGQFYMASLIGILVGLHVSHRQSRSDNDH